MTDCSYVHENPLVQNLITTLFLASLFSSFELLSWSWFVNTLMELRSKRRPMAGETKEERAAKSCADCKTTKTPMWRNGPNGFKTLCNACGIRLRKLLAKRNSENTAKKVKIIKPKKQRTASSVSTKGSTTNPCGANSTTTTANSPPAAAAAPADHGYADGVRTRYSIRSVRFVSNKQRVVKKLRCFQRRRTNFKRTSFFFFEKKWTLPDVEQSAAAALLALSGSVRV